ncbi:hypothetical protein ACKS0A_10857 [Histoplasma ohiense]
MFSCFLSAKNTDLDLWLYPIHPRSPFGSGCFFVRSLFGAPRVIRRWGLELVAKETWRPGDSTHVWMHSGEWEIVSEKVCRACTTCAAHCWGVCENARPFREKFVSRFWILPTVYIAISIPPRRIYSSSQQRLQGPSRRRAKSSKRSSDGLILFSPAVIASAWAQANSGQYNTAYSKSGHSSISSFLMWLDLGIRKYALFCTEGACRTFRHAVANTAFELVTSTKYFARLGGIVMDCVILRCRNSLADKCIKRILSPSSSPEYCTREPHAFTTSLRE